MTSLRSSWCACQWRVVRGEAGSSETPGAGNEAGAVATPRLIGGTDAFAVLLPTGVCNGYADRILHTTSRVLDEFCEAEWRARVPVNVHRVRYSGRWC